MTITIHTPSTSDIQSLLQGIRSKLERKIVESEDAMFFRHDRWFWKAMYRLTGNCGSRLSGHYPVLGNTKSWLWKSIDKKTRTLYRCTICGDKFIYKRVSQEMNYSAIAKKGRDEDAKQLHEMRKNANEAERVAIDKSLYKINHEDRRKGTMREALIKATREHDHPNIKGIHEEVGSKSWYRNNE